MGPDLGKYLEECKRYCANSDTPNEGLSLLKKLKKSQVTWCELHCILYYLHGKVGVLYSAESRLATGTNMLCT